MTFIMTDDARFTIFVNSIIGQLLAQLSRGFKYETVRAASKFVHRLLTEDQIQSRISVCENIAKEQQLRCNFFLFPKTNIQLKEQRFYGMSETEAESRALRLNIKKRTFQTCFQQQERRLVQHMNAESDYFESGNNGLQQK